MTHFNEQLHQLSETTSSSPLSSPTDNDGEEAANQSQVAAGVCIELFRIPPDLTCRQGTFLLQCTPVPPESCAHFYDPCSTKCPNLTLFKIFFLRKANVFLNNFQPKAIEELHLLKLWFIKSQFYNTQQKSLGKIP